MTAWLAPPSAWQTLERRRHARVRVDTYADVWIDDGRVPRSRRIVDMSVGGCAIELLPFDIGTVVRLSINLSPVASSITLEGRVVRHDSDGALGFTGIEFIRAHGSNGVLLDYLLWASTANLAASLHR